MTLTEGFNLLATAPDGIKRLRELILSLAVQGKLVPQDPTDEPASELLKQIRAEKDRLIFEGKIKKDKPLPAIGDDEKPFALPEGWEWSMIAEVGITSPRNSLADDVEVSFVQMSSIPAALFHPHLTENRLWKDVKAGFTHFAEGDVGVAKITPCFENGKSVVFRNLQNGFGAGTTELHVVRPLGGVNPNYILLYLKNPMFLKDGEVGMTGSAGQKRLSRQFFEYNLFPLPPLAEQSRIVAKVEELMALCDALETRGQLETEQHTRLTATLFDALAASESAHQLQENWARLAANFDLVLDRPQAVDALEQTILQLAVRGLLVPQDPADEPASELLKQIRTEKDRLIAEGKIKKDKPLPAISDDEKPFNLPQGWEWVRLGMLYPEFQNGASSRGDQGGIPITVLRLADIKNGAISLADTREISIKPSDMEKYFLRKGDILITRVNGSAELVGRFTMNEHNLDAIYCDHFIRMRLDSRLIFPAYLRLLGDSALVREKIAGLFITTAGQKTVNQGHMTSLLLTLPPLAEQSRIVARVDALRALCGQLRQRLAASRDTQGQLASALLAQG